MFLGKNKIEITDNHETILVLQHHGMGNACRGVDGPNVQTALVKTFTNSRNKVSTEPEKCGI